MKINTKYLPSLLIGLFISTGILAQYCIPPGFKDMGGSGEPFTFISNVQLGELNNSSGIPTGVGDDNGYTYFSSQTKPSLQQGGNYTLKVTANDNIAAGMVVVVWVDWNNDKTFEPLGERVALWGPDGNHSAEISVPSDAPDGVVRMRVYCDMPSSMGHIDPDPCGYLNYPSHAIGQHGEVEDYDIRIGSPTGISSNEKSESVRLYPNPARNILNIDHSFDQVVRYSIVDLYGRNIAIGQLHQNQSTINVSNIAVGQYIIMIQGETQQIHQSFYISH